MSEDNNKDKDLQEESKLTEESTSGEELDEFGLEDDASAEEIVERVDEKDAYVSIFAVFIGLCISMILYSGYVIYDFSTDDSVPLTVCPRDYTLDAPILMNRIQDHRSIVHERWIRGFSRRYLTKMFPRTKADVKPFYEYLASRSKEGVKSEYEARLEDIELIASAVDGGKYNSFYAKDGGKNIRIRPVKDSSPQEWIIEQDGYMIINDGLMQKRDTPVVRLKVQAGSPTKYNPEGLYVIEKNVKYTEDYVSGNEIEEIKDEDE